MDNLTERMQQWRNGEISHGEMLMFLAEAQVEVTRALCAEEIHEAEQRFNKAGRS